jgi:hypothetical protein
MNEREPIPSDAVFLRASENFIRGPLRDLVIALSDNYKEQDRIPDVKSIDSASKKKTMEHLMDQEDVLLQKIAVTIAGLKEEAKSENISKKTAQLVAELADGLVEVLLVSAGNATNDMRSTSDDTDAQIELLMNHAIEPVVYVHEDKA